MDSNVQTAEDKDLKLDQLLGRIQQLTAQVDDPSADISQVIDIEEEGSPIAESPQQPTPAVKKTAKPVTQSPLDNGSFYPPEPASITAAGLVGSEVEALTLKFLNARAEATGREISDQVKLPFRLIDPLLQSMKLERLVAHRGSSMMNDYVFELTDSGRERARKLSQHCSYFGSAPVTLKSYIDSVSAQTITSEQPTEKDLHRAFSDLLINKRMLAKLGPAISSGRGMFLFGFPGNGKTSIAERITKAYGETVWIPRCIGIDGDIMRLFDPSLHEEVPLEAETGLIDHQAYDKRWVRIKRPTVVVGGELTMDALEVTLNTITNVSEAPIQMKSNTGTLVIDDFGRQRMSTDELLNRWIVPLEKRYDFLNMSSGKKIQVPFDQLIVFSTNLEPKELVDDAFLRRIPYKIEVEDPSEEDFKKLFEIMAPIIKVKYNAPSVEYLINTHYKPINRPFRCCQPRDLLAQIKNFCAYKGLDPEMTNEYFDFAVENYFAVM